MSKEQQIDLRVGDCLEVLKDIQDKSIDCIITSPPQSYQYVEEI